MIIIQLVLFCAIFITMVRISVIGGAKNALYFYPKAYQEIAYDRGMADRKEIQNKRKRFMIPFMLVMFAALLLIVGLWIKPEGFIQAYLYNVLLLEVMNWFDGIVIDKIWVGLSPFWKITGMEDVPYVQSWMDVLKKRGLLTVIFIVLAFVPAGICMVF